MVHLIVGNKGKGKTKVLLDRVNEQIRSAKGDVVYIDQSMRHMYELNNRIRLVDASRFPLTTGEQLIGFICGIISQNSDIEILYLDGLLKLDDVRAEDVPDIIKKMDKISSEFDVDMTLSISMDQSELPDDLKGMVAVAL
ncbi:MAG: twitching motility protein PilT [Lachnospiraceae bacterium]|jgi:hypothetical protein|nr:twitching motility protein PilT [Lachnospiraceae bacterium]